MAGLGNIFSLFGGPNPEQDIADWSNNQQAQNRRAIGLDANGNPQPAGGPPPDTLPPGQEPNATKTPQSLGALMMSLQRNNEADQLINQGTGAIFSGFAQPRDRERVSHIFDATQPDPLAIAKTQQDLAANQQGQDRVNALGQTIMNPQTALPIARALNMPGADGGVAALQAAFRADPAGVGRMIETTQHPTPAVANLDQITRYMQAAQSPNPDKPLLSSLRNQILASVAGTDAAPMIADQLDYFDKHGTMPPWHDNLQAYHQHVADQADLSKSVGEAAVTHGHNISSVIDMSNRIDDLKNNPALNSILNSKGLKKTWAQNMVNDNSLTPVNILARSAPAGVSFTDAEMAVISDIRQLQGQNYANALHALGLSRPSEREIEGIKSGLGQTGNLSLSPDAYKEQGLDQTNEMVKTMIGGSFGASQNLKDIPDRFKPYVDPQFLAGGTRNVEGSGSEAWADSIKPNAEEIAAAKAALKKGIPRWKVDMLMRSKGMAAVGY